MEGGGWNKLIINNYFITRLVQTKKLLKNIKFLLDCEGIRGRIAQSVSSLVNGTFYYFVCGLNSERVHGRAVAGGTGENTTLTVKAGKFIRISASCHWGPLLFSEIYSSGGISPRRWFLSIVVFVSNRK